MLGLGGTVCLIWFLIRMKKQSRRNKTHVAAVAVCSQQQQQTGMPY